nr:Transmembrane and ubiquitin [Hymenolepis microstoma]
MLLPEFIEGVGNEVLVCALTLGGILFCIGARLYNNGIRMARSQTQIQSQSTNSNSTLTETADATSPNENVDDYHIGVLDTEYMELLRDPNYNLDSGKSNIVEIAFNYVDENTDAHASSRDKKRVLEEVRDSGNIVIRLQYLNDHVRYVHAPPDMPVAVFKKKFFADELERQNKSVRLIFQGRELKLNSPENPTKRCLRDYGVSDNSTIHCLISDALPRSTGNQNGQQDTSSTTSGRTFYHTTMTGGSEDIDFGSHALMPLLAFLLISAWLFRLTHSEYFSLLSTVALICLSAVFLGSVYSSVYNSNDQSVPRVDRSSSSSSIAAGDAMRS